MERPDLQRYALGDELGQGGMSVVYRARDAQLQRDVAVKILHRYLARQPEARRRLHREAVAVARLRHRAIVEIFDYSGPDAEEAFIVCELIEGLTLREYVERHGAPGPEVALMVGLELADALAHAHGEGIIHRDLKPENVMIGPDGQLKLMDFSIAQVLEGQTRLTSTGTLIGSPAHMAPEVIDGKPADHRADLFSLGTLLYWLATGSLPFTAPHPSALFKRILDGHYTPADEVEPQVGRGARRLIDACLQSDPPARPESAIAFAERVREELATVDLGEPDATLRGLLTEPDSHRERFEAELVKALIVRAQQALEAREWATASDAVNRVLARVPDHAEANALLQKLARGERRGLLLRRAAWAAVPAGLLIWLSTQALEPPPSPPEPEASGRGEAAPVAPVDLQGLGAREPATPTSVIAPPTRDPAPRDRAAARRPAATSSRPPPRPADATSTPDAATTTDTAVASATLEVTIGRGYADVYLNGRLALDSKVRGSIELPPGTHRVEVVRDRSKILRQLGLEAPPAEKAFPMFGRFQPRVLRVASTGEIFEIGPSGSPRPLKDATLRFSIPMGVDEAERTEGWISS